MKDLIDSNGERWELVHHSYGFWSAYCEAYDVQSCQMDYRALIEQIEEWAQEYKE